jgi:hypothetical protein
VVQQALQEMAVLRFPVMLETMEHLQLVLPV